jgi:perosamine synthetase
LIQVATISDSQMLTSTVSDEGKPAGTPHAVRSLVLPLALRPARWGDRELLFEWRNRPEIVAKGRLPRTVTRAEHEAWLRETLSGSDRKIWILFVKDEPAGQIRFDRQGETAEVSIYLLDGFTGRGFGPEALCLAIDEIFAEWDVHGVTATIRKDNDRSIAAFCRSGFSEQSIPDDRMFVHLLRPRPPAIPHNRITASSEEVEAVARVAASGHWAGGPAVARLEEELSRRGRTKSAIGVSSGLSAIRLTLLSIGVGAGDRVVVPSYCCVAIPNAVLACGAKVVVADIEQSTWNVDPEAVSRSSVDAPIKAIIAVSTFGVPAAIAKLATFGVPVIEDCAHAFGIEVEGKALGSRATATVLSLYATKLIGAGEGGAVLTDDQSVAKSVRSLRDYTDLPAHASRLNDKMNDLEAALAFAQLGHLEGMLAARAAIAERYRQSLGVADGIRYRVPLHVGPRVWYRYAIELLDCDATEVIDQMVRHGVQAERPVTDWRHERSSSPVATHAYRRLISLPLYPTLSAMEQDRVIDVFLRSLGAGASR